jgi:predicted nucleic acid-binding protein
LIYLDTNYVVRLYAQDAGWQNVRRLAGTDEIACALHGRVETTAAFHRKLREGFFTAIEFAAIMKTFEQECKAGAFHWLPVTTAIAERAFNIYSTLPTSAVLRGADAVHLACAAENGFKEIYSNDKHLLNAASYFGLIGKNIL